MASESAMGVAASLLLSGDVEEWAFLFVECQSSHSVETSQLARAADESAQKAIAEALDAFALAERERCAAICDRFVAEREAARARFLSEPVGPDDPRPTWVHLKASEAKRCADAIRRGVPDGK